MSRIFTIILLFLYLNCFSQVNSDLKFKNERLPTYLAYGGGACLLIPYGVILYQQTEVIPNKKQVNIMRNFMLTGLVMVTFSVSIGGRRERIREEYEDYLIRKKIRKDNF